MPSTPFMGLFVVAVFNASELMDWDDKRE
jgi:hypothetical protein